MSEPPFTSPTFNKLAIMSCRSVGGLSIEILGNLKPIKIKSNLHFCLNEQRASFIMKRAFVGKFAVVTNNLMSH